MKFVHWAKYYPPEWGGMERVTHDLAVGMARLGHEVSVVAFTAIHSKGGEEVRDAVTIVRTPVSKKIFSQPLTSKWIREAFERSRSAETILIHTPNLLALFPLILLRLFGLATGRSHRVLIYWHSDIVGKGVLGVLVRPFEHLMLMLADKVAATSSRYADASPVLRRHRAKLALVPLGIATPPEGPNGPMPSDVATFLSGAPYGLAVGRLVPYKGFDTLIEAAARADQTMKLVIVGAGPLHEVLEHKIAEAGVGDKVMLVGSQSAADLATLFRGAQFYVMASVERAEAFGVVLLEAMGYGLPLIATEISGSGVPWVAGDGVVGPMVQPGDSADLALALVHVSVDETMRKVWAKGALSRQRGLFTVDKMIEGILRLANCPIPC